MSIEEAVTRHYGEKSTPERNCFDSALELDRAAQQIKQLRKVKGLTQEQLGQIIGVKKSQISRLEKGDANVTLGTLSKVFRALNASVTLQIKLSSSEEAAFHL